MPHVNAHPSEIRSFAASLKSASHDIDGLQAKLRSSLRKVKGTWRDQQVRKAEEAIKAAVAANEKAKRQIDETQRYCLKLARHLENTPR